jgi:hypothetical protein
VTTHPAGEAIPRTDAPLAARIPDDPKLIGLKRLFDRDWAWEAFCRAYGAPDEPPDQVRLQHLIYRPGSRAVVGYVTEREWDSWVVEEQFAFELLAGEAEPHLFRYPDDPYLPGLALVAAPLTAHELLPRYVALKPDRLLVERVRYRPTVRAVLRHHARWRRREATSVTSYVRVMPPDAMARFLTAGELVSRSGFVIPRLLGHIPEEGVVWLASVPGKTVRSLIRRGSPPDPQLLLDGLAPLWSAETAGDPGDPRDVAAGLRSTRRLLLEVLPEGKDHPTLRRLLRDLTPFADGWAPTALAHNDFYDDQIILTPTGSVALVDFEEAGPGDPLLDVGNMLGHLRWMSRYNQKGSAYGAYREQLLAATLDRFGWEARDLALREAFALYRLSTNSIRNFRDDWRERVETVLSMAADVLDGS